MKIDDNGIHLHQSDLKNHCLEKLRLDTIAVGPRQENDAATVGTVLHTVIEDELVNGFYESEQHAVQHGAYKYVELLEQYSADGNPYVMGTFGSHEKALFSLENLVRSWYRCDDRSNMLSSVEAPIIEWKFDLPFTEVKYGKKKTDIIPVFLAGMSDIIWQNKVIDWKSSSSEYRRWELQRWGRQPDVYTWAAAQAGLIAPNKDGLYDFEFKVFVRGNQPILPQTVTVQRGPNNWLWLGTIVDRLVKMAMTVGVENEWPLDDQHVLCSPKWCGFFDVCKGAVVNGETWV